MSEHEHTPCLFCGGVIGPDHFATCDGRQGVREYAHSLDEMRDMLPSIVSSVVTDDALPFRIPGMGPDHDGTTYEPEHDHVRLNAQTLKVWAVLQDGAWWTLREIASAIAAPEASVSARLRDLRKAKFGGHTVERRRLGEARRGLHEYRLIPNPQHAVAS